MILVRQLIFVLSISLIFCHFQANAQYQFEHYTVEDGLSQSTIYTILQDHKGFLWFGTMDGLNRFDGHNFKKYYQSAQNRYSVADNTIYSVAEDQEGNLWCGTKNGLSRFDYSTGRFTNFYYQPKEEDGIPDYAVTSVLITKEQVLWINSGLGVSRYDSVRECFFHYLYKDVGKSLTQINHHYQLIEDHTGKIWAASPYGLFVVDPVKSVDYASLIVNPYWGSDEDKTIICIYEYSPGVLWVGTNNGLDIYDLNTNEWKKFDHPLLSLSPIRSICKGHRGCIWISTAKNGIFQIPCHREAGTNPIANFVHNPEDPNSPGADAILSMMEDRSGVLWFGTDGSGIIKTDNKTKKFRLFNNQSKELKNKLLSNDIASIFIDKEDKLWVGTWGDGLNIFDRENDKVVYYSTRSDENHRISNDYVHEIYRDNNSTIFIGTRNGVIVYQEGSGMFTPFQEYFKLESNPVFCDDVRIYSIIKDRNDNYWFGTTNGAHKYNIKTKSTISYYHNPDDSTSISNNHVNSVIEDSRGTIWLGTLNGFNQFVPASNSFKQYKSRQNSLYSLSDNSIYGLYDDRKGHIWIGTGNGINMFDVKYETFKSVLDNTGIPFRKLVYDILGDYNGNLWFSTNSGIYFLDRTSDILRGYDNMDGLQSKEFNIGACFRSKQGELFFGGINGFNSFFPDSLKDNAHVPNTVITKVELTDDNGKKEVDLFGNNTIDLSEDVFQVTIEFASLEFTKPEKNNYSYVMEGISPEWIDIGGQTSVSFINLSPGKYQFKVKGTNNDGVWSDEAACIGLVVQPRWWKTYWAYAIYGFLILVFLSLYIRVRERKLKKNQRNLEEKVIERTEQIESQARQMEDTNMELEKLSIVASEIKNAVAIILPEGEVEWVNHSFVKLYGYTLREFKHKFGNDYFSSPMSNGFAGKNNLKASVTFTKEYTKPDDTIIWIQTTLSPIINELGEVGKIIAIDTDVTEMHQYLDVTTNMTAITKEILSPLRIIQNACRSTQIANLKILINSVPRLIELDDILISKIIALTLKLDNPIDVSDELFAKRRIALEDSLLKQNHNHPHLLSQILCEYSVDEKSEEFNELFSLPNSEAICLFLLAIAEFKRTNNEIEKAANHTSKIAKALKNYTSMGTGISEKGKMI